VICGGRWHENALPPGSDELAHAWRPYFEAAIDVFGVERCMFESNFPVDKGMVSYPVLWNAFKRLASAFSESEKSALFHDNACRFYRIAA
jgi:predicted TIM-barrel fold metal-dependent hydrolase